ncbi:MBOAT family O-acyltransferase [Kribbella sp. DT2]|uniref:MBOAT family O-acyltransferase n=1 Tax=Kribbella sp. DT2 TaxID=3393427 RepID=UPI003CE79601
MLPASWILPHRARNGVLAVFSLGFYAVGGKEFVLLLLALITSTTPRRWHQSLSRWFRDYLYVPLGGNRGGTFRTYRNLSIVFLATGLWHGAAWTFVIWGAFHGLLLIVERATGLGRSDRWAAPRRGSPSCWSFSAGCCSAPSRCRPPDRCFRQRSPHDLDTRTGRRRPAVRAPDRAARAGARDGAAAGDAGDRPSDRRTAGGAVWARRSIKAVALALTPYAGIVAVAGTFSPFLYFQF